MTTKRITVKTELLSTRDEAESAMTELAAAVNHKRRLTAQRDAEVLAINTKYESGLANFDYIANQKTDALRAWAEANPDQFPKGRKSIDMTSGVLGFRIGMPRLALFSRAFNWERVLALVEQFWPGFIRIKKEVDKEGLLAQHGQATDKTAATADLQRLGLKVTQDETFFIEPKLTETETRQTQDAS